MGKLINMFSALFGLGLAAGAAFYIYRTRKCSGERESDNTEERVIPDYKVGGDASVTENECQIVDLSMELAAQPTNQTQTRASKKKPRNRGTRHTEAPVLLASETMLVHKSKAMLRENEALETISNTGTVRSRLTEFVVASTTSLIDSTLACFTTGRKRRRVRMSVSFAFEFVCEEVEEQSIENVGFNQVDSS